MMVAHMNYKLSLDNPTLYEIKISGFLTENWYDWITKLIVTVERLEDNPPITILTGRFDQAALHGLLRRLYSLGFPLISVNYIQQIEESSNSNQEIMS